MWKDYLYFTRKEKRAIILLLIIMALLTASNFLIPRFVKSESRDYTAIMARIDTFYARLEADSIKKAMRFQKYPPIIFGVDTVSAKWLVLHSMPRNIANNIVNYRSKGGRIENGEKFRSIYGMTDSVFSAWKPFVKYPPTKSVTKIASCKNAEPNQPEKTVDFQIDINHADTAELVVLYGIGPSFAERIVKYRKALGGFCAINQVAEVYGMDSARFNKIKPYLLLTPTELKKLPVNLASLRRMKYHPYFNFYQARAVYEHRKAGNVICSWDDFLRIENLDTAGMKYLPPYLDYSIPQK